MITFETQEDFDAAVLKIIKDNLTLHYSNRCEDYYSKNETFNIELILGDEQLGSACATIPHF